MVGCRWLIAVAVLSGCVVRVPGGAARITLRPTAPAPSCGDRSVLVRVHNPGPAPVMVESVVLAPGWTALCMPAEASRLIAVEMWETRYGGRLAPVLTPDRQAAIGYPIEVIERGETFTTAIVDTRQRLRVALRQPAAESPPPSVADAAPPRPAPVRPRPPVPAPPPPAIEPVPEPPRPTVEPLPVPEPLPPVPEPLPPVPLPPAPAYAGQYRLVSDIDLAGMQVMGADVSDMLVELSEFREHPTPVLLKVMRKSKVGYPVMESVWNIWDAIPDDWRRGTTRLVDKALVLMFDHVDELGEVAALISELAEVSRHVQLETELTIGELVDGAIGSSSHVLTRVALTFRNHERWIAIPAALGRVTRVSDAHPSIEWAAGSAGSAATLVLGHQRFQAAYGKLLFDELAARLFVPAGVSDLGGWLDHKIDCGVFEHALFRLPGIARVLGSGVLRGHCSHALMTLGAMIEQEVRRWSLDLVDMASGRCEMTSRDGTQIDELANGRWTMKIRVHGRDLQVAAPFRGVRVAP